MKKQLLTLMMCMVLTATSAFAATTATPVKKAPCPVKATVTAPAKNCPCAKAAQTPCAEPALTPEQAKRKAFEEKIAKDRAELYCKLGLSEQQKLTAGALEEKTKSEMEPLFAKLHEERAKLKDLKANNACPMKIAEQKMKVKAVKKDIKKEFKAAQKSFEEILTNDQLAKFKTIKEERKAERKERRHERMKEHCKCHFPCAPGCPCKCHRHHACPDKDAAKEPAKSSPCPADKK